MAFSITIDTGGTFTDRMFADEARARSLFKAATTPDDSFARIRGRAARPESRTA